MRLKKPVLLTGLLATVISPNPARKFFDNYVWSKVIDIAEPFAAPVWHFLLDWGPSLALFMWALYLSLSPAERALWIYRAKRMNVWLLIGGAGAAIFGIGAVGFWWDNSRGPIIWLLDLPASPPVAWTRYNDGPVVFGRFEMTGINRWEDPVNPTEAYIQSNVTSTRVPLTFANGMPITVGTIQPGAKFMLYSVKPWYNPESRPSLAELKKTFASFTFVFKSPTKDYSIRFEESDVDSYFAISERLMIRKPIPTVVQRD